MAQPYLPGQVLLAAAVPDSDLLWREAPPRRPHLVVPIFETDGGLIAAVPVTVTPEAAMQSQWPCGTSWTWLRLLSMPASL